jgi:hypothetical protein
MSITYDPMTAPEKEAWLELPEFERLQLVVHAHRELGVRLPNDRLHAAAHMVVENQVALGDETPVEETVLRLMDEGLDRHDAVHAVGAVVMNHIRNLMADEDPATEDPNRAYHEELRRFSAQQWIDRFGGR